MITDKYGVFDLCRSGRSFNLVEPRVEDVHLPDLVWHCSHIARYNGSTLRGYTVLEHLVVGAKAIITTECKGAMPAPGTPVARTVVHYLGHDLHEGYYQDITTPLKALLPEYQALEKRGAAVMREALGLDVADHPIAHAYDKAMKEAEIRWLIAPAGDQKMETPTQHPACNVIRFGHKQASAKYWRGEFQLLWNSLGMPGLVPGQDVGAVGI